MARPDKYAKRRGHELMPDDVAKTIPSIESTAELRAEEITIVARFFAPGYVYLVCGYDPENDIVHGWCILNNDLQNAEWGSAWVQEWREAKWDAMAIDNLNNTLGYAPVFVERDMHFTPKLFGEAQRETLTEMGLIDPEPRLAPDYISTGEYKVGPVSISREILDDSVGYEKELGQALSSMMYIHLFGEPDVGREVFFACDNIIDVDSAFACADCRWLKDSIHIITRVNTSDQSLNRTYIGYAERGWW